MSDIKMKIRAEVDPTSISNIKKEIEGLSQNIKPLKIKTESKDLMKITRDMEKVKSTINSMNNTKIKVFDENGLRKSGAEFVKVAETAEKSMRQIENQYKKMGETSIQGKNWNTTTKELDQFTVKVKESEGVVKKYKYTLAELENGQKVWINQSIKGSEDQQKNVQNLIKSKKDLLNVEKQLDNLQHKAGSLDKNSTEYKKVTQEVERLRDTQKEYMQDLDKLSKADLNKLKTEVKGVDTELNKALKQQKEMKKETIDSKKFAGDMQTVGRNLMALSAPVMAVGAASIKAKIDFESSFAGMRKTIDASEQDFAKLEKGVREMSKTFPQSASEIAAVGEIAGQLGVQKEHILDFTKVMIMLGDSTNLSSAEAADSLARFRNITQMSFDDMDRLGATIVDLGKLHCPVTWRQVA